MNPLLDRLVPAVATTPAERAAAWCLRRWLLVLIPVPDKTRVVHLFAGKVDLSILRGDTLDIRPELDPTFCVDAETCPGAPLEQYDLVVADPPYSAEDAAHYGTPMVNRDRVMRTLAERLAPGCYVVWLDQVLPRYRKAVLAREASIGVSRSTGHRNRCVDIFRRRDPGETCSNEPTASPDSEAEDAAVLDLRIDELALTTRTYNALTGSESRGAGIRGTITTLR